MSTSNAFEDRFAIRELIDRWSDAVNEHDWEQLAACLTEDSVWDVGAPYNFRMEGLKTIMDSVPGLIEEQLYVIQTPHAVVIHLNGDSATVRTTMQEMMRGPDGSGMQMWGTYYDDVVRTEAGWRFKLRRFRTAVFEAKPAAGEMFRTYGDPS